LFCSEAIAYALYMTTNTFLAAAVVAMVLFYGGTLVLRGAMSAGALVSFMLFQQSLSSSFQVRPGAPCPFAWAARMLSLANW
jgi:ATP-binding cassette subfamily B (MDR/TAP) protein 9